MRRQRDEGYVLTTQQLGEADLIVTLLAERHGKVRGVARSGRKSRQRFGGALEALTRVRADWVEREGRELQRLESLDCVRSFASMQADPELQCACAVLAEVTAAFAHEGQAEPETFRLLGALLEALEQGGDPRSLIRYFEYWTLRIHGLLPDLASCAVCGRPLASDVAPWVRRGTGLRCAACPPGRGELERRLTADDRAFLDAARRLPPDRIPRSRRAGNGALELLLRGSLESYAERRFRSYRHFRASETPGQGGTSS